jgi:hypothetical protein
MEQFTSRAQVKHQAVVVPRSEGIVQLDNKWLLQASQYIPLAENLLEPQVIPLHRRFLNHFHGIQVATSSFSH